MTVDSWYNLNKLRSGPHRSTTNCPWRSEHKKSKLWFWDFTTLLELGLCDAASLMESKEEVNIMSPLWARRALGSRQWLTRGKKVKSRSEREIWNLFLQFREEKEKSVFPFPTFEKRKRNLNSISTLSRGEREIWISFPQFREEKEKSEFYFHTFERRKRNLNFISPVSRKEREIWTLFPHFQEEKEKSEFHFPTSKRREIEKSDKCS